MIFCVGITHLVLFFFNLETLRRCLGMQSISPKFLVHLVHKPKETFTYPSNIAHIFGKSTPCRLKHLTMKPQRFSMVCSMVVQPGSAGHPGFHFWGRHEIMLRILAPGRAPKNQRRNKKKRNLLFDDPVPYLSLLLIMSSPSSSVMLPVSSSWSSCSVRFSEREGIRMYTNHFQVHTQIISRCLMIMMIQAGDLCSDQTTAGYPYPAFFYPSSNPTIG